MHLCLCLSSPSLSLSRKPFVLSTKFLPPADGIFSGVRNALGESEGSAPGGLCIRSNRGRELREFPFEVDLGGSPLGATQSEESTFWLRHACPGLGFGRNISLIWAPRHCKPPGPRIDRGSQQGQTRRRHSSWAGTPMEATALDAFAGERVDGA